MLDSKNGKVMNFDSGFGLVAVMDFPELHILGLCVMDWGSGQMVASSGDCCHWSHLEVQVDIWNSA